MLNDEALNHLLPILYMGLLGITILFYVLLDGFDLGIGMLLTLGKNDEERDTMMGCIGPFWDANETWLVLGIGILLLAFPAAHGTILPALYLPIQLMIGGLILRGAAYEFRVRDRTRHPQKWDRVFQLGSFLAAFMQGTALGLLTLGLQRTSYAIAFAMFIGLCVAAAYILLGSCWLIVKTEGDLQKRAGVWARYSLLLTAIGILAISIILPAMSSQIFLKWFSLPAFILLGSVPVMLLVLIIGVYWALRHEAYLLGKAGHWLPYIAVSCIVVLTFCGIGYSFYPYLIVDHLDIWQAAAAPIALKIGGVGIAVVLPMIMAYNLYVHRVFKGKIRGGPYHPPA
jgi:cytochrome d ubiquinol oxidase subunit II